MEKKIGKEKSGLWTTLMQFVKFGLVGISNTVISWVTYALCIRVGCHWFIASVVSFLISVLNAFYWNNKYVFKGEEERVWWKALIRTYVAYGTTGLVLNNILLFLWLEILHIEGMLTPVWQWLYDFGLHFENPASLAEYIAPVFNYVITIPLNFILNKFWAYGDKRGLKEKKNED